MFAFPVNSYHSREDYTLLEFAAAAAAWEQFWRSCNKRWEQVEKGVFHSPFFLLWCIWIFSVCCCCCCRSVCFFILFQFCCCYRRRRSILCHRHCQTYMRVRCRRISHEIKTTTKTRKSKKIIMILLLPRRRAVSYSNNHVWTKKT